MPLTTGEADTEMGSPARREALELPGHRFDERRAHAPRAVGEVSRPRETREEIALEVLLWEEADRFQVAVHDPPVFDPRSSTAG